MTFAPVPRVKICCISNLEEAMMAIKHGASALGLVSQMPSGPGVISEELIIKIARSIPPAIASFFLTSKQDVKSIVEQQRRCGVNTVQLCDCLTSGTHEEMHRMMPGISIVQVIHVTGPEAITEAKSVAPYVNGILLDSGNPRLSTKQLGGTGRTHDWSISRRIVEESIVPVFLGGGLKPENVVEAFNQVHPFGVDICNGVRTDGRLDERKLSAFFR